jgi:hypothetical protein
MRIVTLTLPRLPKTEDRELITYFQALHQYLQDLNTKVSSVIFSNSQSIDVTTAAADTEFAVTHQLSRVPEHAYISSTNVAGSLYRGTTAWTAQVIYLKFSGANANLKVVVA